MADLSQGSLAHSVPLENENSQLALYDAKPLYTNSIKRCVDVGGAVALIILFFPIGLLIALVLLLCGGSIFFLHHRIGAEGRTFTCLKFRTMIADGDGQLALHLKEQPRAKAEWESHHKLRHDPRVTKFGRFLRRSSLDEIPQLINVVRGEMSLVGPRPIVASEVERYGDRIHDYMSCRPGLTGLWQISRLEPREYARRTELDSLYVGHWSLRRDILILTWTVPTVLRARGAY